jgi:predicted TIM-barrel fold metal-dependent hydrolase
MSDQDELFDDDLIDRIANFVPAEVRAAFYRELRHCRSLPQNDEMLRIIRAMQFLVLIMVKLPEQMAMERERLEQIVSRSERLLNDVHEFVDEATRQIDQRLAQISADIAKALNPQAVAAQINENLRQQFIKTTIPETADALAVNAAQIKKATSEFVSTALTLGGAYDGAVVEARRAIEDLRIHLVPSHHRQQAPGGRTHGCSSSGLSMVVVCTPGPLHTHWYRAKCLVRALDRSGGAIGIHADDPRHVGWQGILVPGTWSTATIMPRASESLVCGRVEARNC